VIAIDVIECAALGVVNFWTNRGHSYFLGTIALVMEVEVYREEDWNEKAEVNRALLVPLEAADSGRNILS
jgi:hypothetical protein